MDNQTASGEDGGQPAQLASPDAKQHCSVHRVAITGGPCAGKTTALAEISERLRSRGFGVYVVPEAATMLFTGGATSFGTTDLQTLTLQSQLLRTQITLEDAFVAIARTSNYKECFILCDRGTCDGRAYMTPALWRQMLKQNDWDMVSIRDGRYELVVHLVTAADGALDYYTLDNNATRSETPEEAVATDLKTQAAWVGHPHLRIVDNRSGFHEKINRIDARISELAGIHLVRRTVRKFLLATGVSQDENPEISSDAAAAEHFIVEQTFLRTGLPADVQESVRCRGKNGVFTYVHKVRREGSETKRQINTREYNAFVLRRDPSRFGVRIRRRCFLFKGTYFVLDCVVNVKPKVSLLRCHCEDGDDRMQMPPWLKIDEEVTGDKRYSMHALALNATVGIDDAEDFDITDRDALCSPVVQA